MSKHTRRRIGGPGRPRGAVPMPSGGYRLSDAAVPAGGKRQIRIEGLHREQPDMKRLAYVLLDYARQLQAERQRQDHDEAA